MEPIPFSPTIRSSCEIEDSPEEQEVCNRQLQLFTAAIKLYTPTQRPPQVHKEVERMLLDGAALSLSVFFRKGYRPSILSQEGRIQEVLFTAWSNLYMRSIAINLRLLKYANWGVMSYRVSKPDAPEKRVHLLGTVHLGSRFLGETYEKNYLRRARTILASCKRLFLEIDPLQEAQKRGLTSAQVHCFLFNSSVSIPSAFFSTFLEKYFSGKEIEKKDLSFCVKWGVDWNLALCAASMEKEIFSLDPENSRDKADEVPSAPTQPEEQRQKDFERLGDMSMICDMLASLALRQHYTKFYSRSSLQSNLQREKLYLAKIDTLLTDAVEGDSMVAVGIAHVERTGSLVSRLLEKGYTVEQVPLRA